MAESIMISSFLFLLILIQYREQRKIKIVAKSSWVKKILSVLLSSILLLVFWSNNVPDQIKLIAFSVLIIIFGFMKEGLTEHNLVKLGVLEGDFHDFKKIQIEELPNHNQFISFYKNKNSRL
ncbi:hypothetical protein [Enterococcus devriesei]|nr:hypothetical protein [Enterococcus devriesei]